MTVPHRSQGFGGKYLAGLGIDYLKKASVQCNGYPISHALINGFNGPPSLIPAEQPVSICPEAVKRAGPFANCARSFRFAMPWPCALLAAMYSSLCAGK